MRFKDMLLTSVFRRTIIPATGWLLFTALAPMPALAQGSDRVSNWQTAAVLDVATNQNTLALGWREKGLAAGHSDLMLWGRLTPAFDALLLGTFHSHEGSLKGALEGAWLQTRQAPFGLQARAGRFASQIGYLNEQHPHADDFTERPLLHRAFLGGHWFDDGLRLNWTAPTPVYLRLGLEVFKGGQLIPEASASRSAGAVVSSLRMGGDWQRAHSWQLGLSHLSTRRTPVEEADHAAAEGSEGEHAGHAARHGASWSSKNLWVLDGTWKWAPEGNNHRQQLRVSAEHAQGRGNRSGETSSPQHQASYLAVVWRFAQGWEAGWRRDWLRVSQLHEDERETARLQESSLMLAWKPLHQHTLRLQFSQQQGDEALGKPRRTVMLQYVLGLGAHPAHTY